MNKYRIFYKYSDKQGINSDYTEIEAKNKEDAENLFWDISLFEQVVEDQVSNSLRILDIEPLEVVQVILTDNDFAKLKQGKTVYQSEKDIEIRISKEQDLRF